jgi:4-hydroxyproline epimerase
MERIRVIDSHTGGEPTRVVIEGGPPLGGMSIAEARDLLSGRWDGYRSAIVHEPRGSDVLVGAWLLPPTLPGSLAGVLFFNNVGPLGMCGHGMIGVMATLAHLGRVQPGWHRMETPVGVVEVEWTVSGRVTLLNVASHRKARGIRLQVPGVGTVSGDVAWGGNWFFLCEDHGQELRLDAVSELTGVAWAIRQEVNRQGYPEVDHVELFGPPHLPGSHSRNFVLCPGKAYDRSPCGTGTSAKVACLAEDGKLAEDQPWFQESILGTVFEASYQRVDGRVMPRISGRAHVTAESTLILHPEDPFRWGIRADAPDGSPGPGSFIANRP